MRFRRRRNPDYNQLRRIAEAGQAVAAQSAADHHGSPSQFIHSAGIFRKKALMGSQKSAGTEGQPDLPSMGMAAENQVKSAFRVVSGQLRTVGQENGIAVGGETAAAAFQLLHPFFRKTAAVMGTDKGVGVVHASKLDGLAL